MLDRNRRIKPKPERFQSCKEHFDVIITCEERVYDQITEGTSSQSFPPWGSPDLEIIISTFIFYEHLETKCSKCYCYVFC